MECRRDSDLGRFGKNTEGQLEHKRDSNVNCRGLPSRSTFGAFNSIVNPSPLV
jgi:hypothetical protein